MATKLSRERLVELIAKHKGNVMHMAADAGVPRKSIYRRLEVEQLHTAVESARRAGELREMRDRAVAAVESARRAAWHALIDLHEELGDDVTGEKPKHGPKPKRGRSEWASLIIRHHGNIKQIAAVIGVTRNTVMKGIAREGLQAELDLARHGWAVEVAIAEMLHAARGGKL